MTAGLIVLQPWADEIITGKKKAEYRKKAPPIQYYNKDIYLLSSGVVLGTIRIHDYSRIRDESYLWKVMVREMYLERKKYIHPNGAQVWVKDVIFGRVTMDDFT